MAKKAAKEKEVAPTPTKKYQGKEKKDKDLPFDRKAELAALKAAINKQFDGRGMVMEADEFSNMFVLRRPFGITGLDVATAGGLPAGTLTEIVGPEGGTKSLLANMVIAGVQQTYGADASIAAEMTEMHYDKKFGKSCGVHVSLSDLDILMWNQWLSSQGLPPVDVGFAKHQVGFFQETIHQTAEGLLEAAAQHIESNLFQIVLIDSLGALMPEDEAENGIEKGRFAGASVAITKFMHRMHAAFNLPDSRGRPNTTTVIAINQKRDNVGGGLFAPEYKISGGNALKHGKTISLMITAGKHHSVEFTKGKYTTVGKEIHWKMLKGKAGCHDGPGGVYDFYYGKHGYSFGVNLFKDLLVCGLQHDVVEQSGAWYSYKGERLGQGADNAAIGIFNNPALYTQMRSEIFVKAGISFITKETF